MNKILLVEDDSVIRESLDYYLKNEEFDVITASCGREALDKVLEDISLILLDINLPDINGFDLFNKIKSIKDIPVIFLTANDMEVSIVRGLDMGADDYIVKPFKARELVSRIKSVLRRNGNINNIITIKNIKIDVTSAKVLKDSRDLFLSSLEYKILLTLALNPNKVFTREKLLADVWDVNEEYVNDNTLTVYIKRIREKIEDDPSDPKIILTIRGMGYKIGD